MIDLSAVMTQRQFGEVVGVSQQAVSDLLARGVLTDGATAGEWMIEYCGNLREMAAGRAAAGDLDLATERARLAKEQADKVAMQNAVSRKELTPTVVLEQVLAGAASKIAGILEAIPGMIRRRVPQLTSADIELIAVEVAKARNTIAAMSLADIDAEAADTVSPAPTFEVDDGRD